MRDELPKASEFDADHLRLVLAAGNIGLWELEVATGEAWRNLGHDQIFGYPDLLEEWTYEMFLDHVVPDERDKVDKLYRQALQEKSEWAFECRIRRADGEIRWISATGKRIGSGDEGNERLIGHVVDVTRIKRAEENLRLLAAEQNHRVRNMLTVLRAMVRMTIRNSADLQGFEEAFMGRMSALIRSQSIFAGKSGSDSYPLDQLIAAELDVFVGSERVKVEGAKGLTVDQSTAEGLTLVLHELLTNCLKYGSLSNDNGQVALRFVDTGPDQGILDWRESGGPEVVPPERTGFGTGLLQSALVNQGHPPRIEYHSEGLRFAMEFPLQQT